MADSEIPDYRYFPARWMKLHGPRIWARLRLLEACKSLGIPKDRWPKFDLDGLYVWPPTKFKLEPAIKSVFELPPFDFVSESPTAWRARADALFRAHCDEYIERCLNGVDEMVKQGFFEKIDHSRIAKTTSTKKAPIIPERIAYEMAAKYYCQSIKSWSALAEEYPPDAGWVGNAIQKAKQKQTRAHQIQRRVQPIISRLGLGAHPRQ